MNQREIKFRAWDDGNTQGEGLNPIMYHFDLTTDNSWILEKKCPVMQFTGLHDKNGKEIYEGDILAPKWQVQWLGDLAAFIIKDVGSTGFENLQLGLQGIIGEVIGNIYENENLLANKPHHD
jgi:YopX protein